MKFNGITELVRNVVDGNNLSSLVKKQEIAMTTTPCTDKEIGRWLDDFGLPVLQDIFSLSDEEFATEFPAMTLNRTDRGYLRDKISEHPAACPHCKMKVEFDEELANAIQAASVTELAGTMTETEPEPTEVFFEVGRA